MGHNKADIDEYTLPQAELFLRCGARHKKRELVLLAQLVSAAALDPEQWKALTKDLREFDGE